LFLMAHGVAPIRISQMLLPGMIERGQGTFITISSGAGYMFYPQSPRPGLGYRIGKAAGHTLVLTELIRIGWGPEALQVEVPAVFSGIVFVLGEPFPTYRLFLAGAGIVVALTIWQFLERTRLGLLIRATSQNAEMVHALGTDVRLVRSAVFGIGCGLAGLGGVMAAPLVTASIGMAATMIIDAFVIVIIGGMGSFPGSLLGAALVAFVQVFGEYYLPDLALAFMYLVMLLVLVVRPGGLLGKEA